MKKILPFLFLADMVLVIFGVMFCFSAFAQTPVVSPQDFFSQVLAFLASWGGLSTFLKAAGIITILISSMNVTYLNTLIWSNLGSFQIWLAPFLGLLAGVFGLGQSGPITPASVFTYITAGAGAVFLHEILDLIKIIPGIGPIWVMVIDGLEGFLGGGLSVKALQRKKQALDQKISLKLARK